MSSTKYRVAVIGCGRMGQNYAEAYTTYPDTEIVAIVDANAQRREVLGGRFDVAALYPDVDALLRDIVPDVAVVVTPTKYMKETVIACAEAGVKGISTEKPIAACLQDADAMVDICAERGVVFAGGNLQRAMNEVQEAASRLHSGEFGRIRGVSVHGFGGEISGGGCQHISVLRLFANAEVEEVIAWGTPPEALNAKTDEGLIINGRFHLTNGLECSVFGTPTSCRGVDVWTDEYLVRWDWNPPEIFKGYDSQGTRVRIDPNYSPYPWNEFSYLTGSIRSFLAAVDGNGHPWITGADLRQALEVAIAAKLSATRNSTPVRLPLEDRSLALYPRPYRWLGGDATGRPQSVTEATG
ncbi:Gfo/Idh/MocA family oxidoreductase [Candidatus Poribacteria bacterium]|nr:Gfo/Idh/MocA family oxidoreductase [Candidatus Poribacteria bacterium]